MVAFPGQSFAGGSNVGRYQARRTADPTDQAPPGFWGHCRNILTDVNNQFHFFVSLPVITALGSALVGHFQYISAYAEKVKTENIQQVTAAETVYTDVATTFSKAVALQQIVLFNFRDAHKQNTDEDVRGLQTKNARALFPQYDDLRISIRQNIDLLARKVELGLDWPSDTRRDAASAKTGLDPMSRIALGAYNFDCDNDNQVPSFSPNKSHIELLPPAEMKKANPNAQPLGLDWYSTKHQLLTLYYCFDINHRRIELARKWAADSPVDSAAKEQFFQNLAMIQDSFDREAVRLNSFLILGARRIEGIRVKFRPGSWICHTPGLRELLDAVGNQCKPIHTALLAWGRVSVS